LILQHTKENIFLKEREIIRIKVFLQFKINSQNEVKILRVRNAKLLILSQNKTKGDSFRGCVLKLESLVWLFKFLLNLRNSKVSQFKENQVLINYILWRRMTQLLHQL